MSLFKRICSLILLFFFFAFSSTAAAAEDVLDRTLRSSIYGGIIGALIGSAIVLLTDDPEDHLSYIPTGAAVGVLVGASYGLVTSGHQDESVGEYEDGNFSLNIPKVKKSIEVDKNANLVNEVRSIDLLKIKF